MYRELATVCENLHGSQTGTYTPGNCAVILSGTCAGSTWPGTRSALAATVAVGELGSCKEDAGRSYLKRTKEARHVPNDQLPDHTLRGDEERELSHWWNAERRSSLPRRRDEVALSVERRRRARQCVVCFDERRQPNERGCRGGSGTAQALCQQETTWFPCGMRRCSKRVSARTVTSRMAAVACRTVCRSDMATCRSDMETCSCRMRHMCSMHQNEYKHTSLKCVHVFECTSRSTCDVSYVVGVKDVFMEVQKDNLSWSN